MRGLICACVCINHVNAMCVCVCAYACLHVCTCVYVVQEIVAENDVHSTSFYKAKEILNPRRDELFNVSMPLLVIKLFLSCFHLASIIYEVLVIIQKNVWPSIFPFYP